MPLSTRHGCSGDVEKNDFFEDDDINAARLIPFRVAPCLCVVHVSSSKREDLLMLNVSAVVAK